MCHVVLLVGLSMTVLCVVFVYWQEVLRAVSDGDLDVLVATDTGIRGDRVPQCFAHVINYQQSDIFYLDKRTSLLTAYGKRGVITTFISEEGPELLVPLQEFITKMGGEVPAALADRIAALPGLF